jgi:hypothetical protein
VDNGKVYESLPLPELKQKVQKSNIIQETAEQSKESEEEQQWQVFQIFSCPLCRFSSPKQQITAEHMLSHIQVHNLRAPQGTLGSAFD